MAMNIISKEKKEIKWLGLPTNSLQECLNLVKEKQQRIDRVKQKTKQLQEIILQVRFFFMGYNIIHDSHEQMIDNF